MRSNLRCWPGDIFGIEAGKSGTSPGDVLGFGWSIVGVAGALQDAVKDMKAIKSARTGFVVIDFRIYTSYLWLFQILFNDDTILPDFW
jgi:hypothetical protein